MSSVTAVVHALSNCSCTCPQLVTVVVHVLSQCLQLYMSSVSNCSCTCPQIGPSCSILLIVLFFELVVIKQSSATSDSGPMFTTGGSMRDSFDSSKDSRTNKSTDIRMIVVWCERFEDKEAVPWGRSLWGRSLWGRSLWGRSL